MSTKISVRATKTGSYRSMDQTGVFVPLIVFVLWTISVELSLMSNLNHTYESLNHTSDIESSII